MTAPERPDTAGPDTAGPDTAGPAMHIIRRTDGEEMGEFAFFATDGPDGWDVAENSDHDDDTMYEILACYPVARRKFLCSTLCPLCAGEGEDDGGSMCPSCGGSGEHEPPDAERLPNATPDPATLQRLRELSDAATDGPWTESLNPHAVMTFGDVADEDADESAFYVVDEDRGINHPEDTAFIIAAVNYVRSQLAAVDDVLGDPT